MIKGNAIKAVFEGSLKLKRGESFLVVTDVSKEFIGRAFYEHAKKITDKADIIVMEPTSEHGAEPPVEVSEKMLEYDVEMLITEKSLTHTLARRNATDRGARIATMPSITEDIANRCLDIDYNELKKRSNRLYDILKNASSIHVTTEKGTDIVFKSGTGKFFGENGGSFTRRGAYGNLPEGELAFAPSEARGTCVIDASFPGLGLLKSPVIFKVENNAVSGIEGKHKGKIKKRLDKIGPRAYLVAELGIGLNPKARIIGNILEDEKVIGTVHMAVGNNVSFGGSNNVPLHLDGVIKNPDIIVDGKELMKKGKFSGWVFG